MTDYVWLHEDALRLEHPACQAGRDAFFIWDTDYFNAQHYSFKRLAFLFETLCEMRVVVYHGTHETVLLERVSPHDHLFVPDTPSPAIQSIVSSLSAKRRITIVSDEPFVQYTPNSGEYRRFFRYWNKAKNSAMQPHGDKQLPLFND